MSTAMRLSEIEGRLTRLEAGASPEALKWAGTVRCANLIVALAADISGETLGDIKSKRKFPGLIVARSAATIVMVKHGGLKQADAARVMAARAQETFEKYTWDVMKEVYIGIHNDLLARGRGETLAVEA